MPDPKMTFLTVPVLPLRDVVICPHMVIPLFVGRDKSIKALENAVEQTDKKILLLAQKDAKQDNPTEDGLYELGTLANILQLLKLPDGTMKVLVEGVQRARVIQFIQQDPFLMAQVDALEKEKIDPKEAEPMLRLLLSQFEEYVRLNKKLAPEIINVLSGIEESHRVVDTLTAHLAIKMSDKQKVLEQASLKESITLLLKLISSEIENMQLEKKISSSVKDNIVKDQRRYYLNEQRKAIDRELEELHHEEGIKSEHESLLAKVEESGMPKEAQEKAIAEINKMKQMPPLSAESTVSRNYIDLMLMVPWQQATELKNDLKQAEAILNEEHYGLEKVKERILEHLAVQQRVGKVAGSVLCLVGPPGVGKTSLGQSIARATGRVFIKMSLGGIRDEAEIRGHRRTYIGSMPGKIIQKLVKAKVINPLFLLDEVDKMGMDFRGDPASALLEVLDPEQNKIFNDHYLEVDYDLSNVMFITTANSLQIPPPLLDRMEVIQLPGYTEDEKLNIALRYLLPKQCKNAGLATKELRISDKAILDIIRYYTREPGVRALEREIAKICRKRVKALLTKKTPRSLTLQPRDLESFLGVRRYRYGEVEVEDQVGQVNGLAWTESGGDLLTIEAATLPGKGKVTITGKLGEVMQESIQAAITVVRSHSEELGIASNFNEKRDIHIHVPEGATPKDGPSAGITVATALASSLSGIPVDKDLAMTGEITLRGSILTIGGLKEKLLAAKRSGIKRVIFPEENLPQLKEMPSNITEGLRILPVKNISEVFALALKKREKGKKSAKGKKLVILVGKRTTLKKRVGKNNRKNEKNY